MKLNWGMMGTGAIAPAFITGVRSSRSGRLCAIAGRDPAKARKLADDSQVPVAYGRYEDLLADANVQAVYICLPHTLHAPWAIRALEAGKHVLCEKPFAVSCAEAAAMIDTARRQDRLIMEAFMYRCHPQTARLAQLVREKVIGEVRLMQGSFSFHVGFDPGNRLFQKHMAGGGILELGGYPVSLSRLVAGVALGCEFADPADIQACGHIGAGGVDERAAALLHFQGDIVAQVAACLAVNQDNAFRIFGSEGQITLPNPYVADRQNAEQGRIIVQKEWQEPYTIDVAADRTSFSYEVDVFAEALAHSTRQPSFPAASNADMLGNARTLELWRSRLG